MDIDGASAMVRSKELKDWRILKKKKKKEKEKQEERSTK